MNAIFDIGDLEARKRALDPTRSFIVQAPAGSGKTELLIQRYLMLLSHVGQPEEIAAITFTRKAASEMRQRVLESLAAARAEECPSEAHLAVTWEHARAALDRDRALGWRLQQNAARLRIQTIDSLCASLTAQMPVLAGFGAQPQIVEDAEPIYREAARATLALLEYKGEPGRLIARLLAHLDNNVALAEDLISDMLARRDHWLRNLYGARDRDELEAALSTARYEAVARVRRLLPSFAGPMDSGSGEDTGRAHALSPAVERTGHTGHSGQEVEAWQRFADELLTQKGEWRKRSTQARTLSADSRRSEPLRQALQALRKLPPEHYSDVQWETLGAITRLLPFAVAQLKLIFAARGQADFVEIARGALTALGETDAPTDLLLSLDYRISHILVDEFQDTSFTQFELLERLTAGWQPGDGRTLFAVGDPTQSIYRFRRAEVGLFLRARHGGIGGIRLEPLTLSVNFRSQADIVGWVNDAFAQIFPADEDIAAGAVPYSRCDPVHPAQADAVRVHAFFGGDTEGEAEQVLALIQAARSEDPGGTIAILVRNRAHLKAIVPRLKESGLRFRAIEIEPLGHRQVVQDLLALTRALVHPADRLAWLAVLRAPWCGLSLADLHALVGEDEIFFASGAKTAAGADATGTAQDLFPETVIANDPPAETSGGSDARTLFELMRDESRLEGLSGDGRARLSRARQVLDHALANRLRGGLRERVEGAWLALGGPACIEDETDLEDAEMYFDHLEQSEQAGDIPDIAALESGVAELHALPDLGADESLQIMTIHKSKGLEFDTVIVPGLGKAPRKRDPSLFLWMEYAADSSPPVEAGGGGAGPSRLLLAPIKETGAPRDPIYDYLVRLEDEKESCEDARLLYVAATRAKTHLHLIGDTRLARTEDDVELKAPAPGSLLEKLWPAVKTEFEEQGRVSPSRRLEAGEAQYLNRVNQDLRRLPSDWRLLDAPPALAWSPQKGAALIREEIEFSWAGETARRVGSVVHRWLQRMAQDNLSGWDLARVEAMRESLRREFAARGVAREELEAAVRRAVAALAKALEDPRGRWLLGPQREARDEYRLTAVVDGVRRNLVIDRTFIDEAGKRWIVDYKTSSHEGAGAEEFLNREQDRYQEQLERYAKALASPRGALLGLYFPLLAGWREWTC